jgi:DNA repair exonuclease SbcCD ATPase subunit
MRKYLIILGIVPFLAACNQDKIKELESRIATLQEDSSAYKLGWDNAEQEITEYMRMMNEIDSNLIEIKKTEGIISTNLSSEGVSKQQQRDDIVASIQTLNELIQKNKKLVTDLDKKYRSSNVKIKELNDQIAMLNGQIEEQSLNLKALQEELAKANFQIATLNTDLNTVTTQKIELEQTTSEQAKVIDQQTIDLNTAYYISGTFKDLRDLGIVDKEGGFIGMGANKELVNNFDPSTFTRIDIRDFKELSLNSKSATIITNHSTDSYTLVEGEKTIEELVINNPQEFWKSSKYLVVLTD